MPTPFTTLTLQRAQALVQRNEDIIATKSRLFYSGDHWQKGDGWIGARPPSTDTSSSVMADIQQAFVSENVIAEVVDRHTSGVVGREPLWRYTLRRPQSEEAPPTTKEQALIDEAEQAMTEWWDRRAPLLALQKAVVGMLLRESVALRLFVPRGLLDTNGLVPSGDLRQSLQHIYLDVCTNGAARVVTDSDTQMEIGIFTYTRNEEQYAEVSFVDDTGMTLLRILSASGVVQEAAPADLAEHLYAHQLHRAPLITEQVCQQQRALNLALTQMMRNVNLAGSLERTLLNAEPPGEWVVDETAPSRRRFVPGPYRVGAGVSNFIQGTEIRNDKGEVIGRANPNISFREPVPIDTFAATREIFYSAILGQTQQKHAAISGDATASGESRKQARAEYEASLNLTKAVIDNAGRWLLETVLFLAAQFAGRAGAFAKLRAEYESTVDAGPLTADEETSVTTQVDKGLLSHETAMSRLGVDDVDSEKAKIQREKAEMTPIEQVRYDREQVRLQADQRETQTDSEAAIAARIAAAAGGTT